MKQAAFIFGRTPQLSFLELQTLIPEATLLGESIGLVNAEVDYASMIARLGGTVRIVELLGTVKDVTGDSLIRFLTENVSGTQITYGISSYGPVVLPATIKQELKKLLVSRGYSARFIETKHDASLSSVVVRKQHVTELSLIADHDIYHVGITRAVQDFEDWNARDFGRPAPDPKRGMLPPKVARMIVNIVKGHTEHPMVLDPFCGVGTIPGEAALLGCNVTGADISEDAIHYAKKNHEWLRAKYSELAPLYANYFVADATHLSEKIAPLSVDAIATEPYMGENLDSDIREKQSPEAVKNTLKGLEKLYIGALKEWMQLLKPGALVMMAMPAYVTQRAIMRVKNVVDRSASLGYTLLTGPIEYSRPQAAVRREFYLFQKKQ